MRRSPCINPLAREKRPKGLFPLKMMEKDEEEMQILIQLI